MGPRHAEARFFLTQCARHAAWKTCMCRRIMMPSSYMRERERENQGESEPGSDFRFRSVVIFENFQKFVGVDF